MTPVHPSMTPEALPEEPSATEAVDRALRRLRPLVGGGLLLYLLGRGSGSDGATLSLTSVAVGATALVGFDLVLRRLRRGGPSSVADALSVALDSFLTVLVVTRLGVLDPELAWALLLIPVLEGALRFRMRGVVVVWCATSLLYVGLGLRVPDDLGDPVTQAAFLQEVQTVVYRTGIVLLVAVPGGYLSDQLLYAIAGQRAAQERARARNAVLVEVVDAGRAIVRSGIDLPEAVVGAALELGFEQADWLRRDARSGWSTVRSAARDGVPRRIPGGAFGGLADFVVRERAVGRAHPSDADPTIGIELEMHGLGEAIAVPIGATDSVASVLRVVTLPGDTASRPQIEGLELLVAQVVVAEDNARLLRDLDAARASLEHQANHDSLTGLANRARFTSLLRRELAALGSDLQPLSVLFLDLDRFKQVNDTLGHDAGDALLVAVSERLNAVVRTSATVARLGGDEFIVLSPSTGADDADVLGQRIVDRIGAPFQLLGHTVEVGASVGIVTVAEPMDPAEVVRRGDVAMYRSKALGRFRWTRYVPELERPPAGSVVS